MARVVAIGAIVVLFVVAPVFAQQPTGTSGTSASVHLMISPGDATWGPAPDSLPAGAEVAVLQGDPSSAGYFTIRVKMPDGYRVAPHTHPTDEQITVLQGTFSMGLGDRLDEAAAKPLGVGGFATMPQGTRHYAIARGETIVQVQGMGPFQFIYVNPSDDPRNKKDQR